MLKIPKTSRVSRSEPYQIRTGGILLEYNEKAHDRLDREIDT